MIPIIILSITILISMLAIIEFTKTGKIPEDIMKDLISAKTIFAFMIYFTFCYLAIKGKIEADIISNALFALMSFYFGYKIGQTQNGGKS